MARINYSREVIEKLYSGRNYEISTDEDTYIFTSSSNGEIPLAGIDKNGEEYDFMGEGISIVRKGIGSMPDSEPQFISVADRPTAPDANLIVPTGEPDDMFIDDIEITEDSITLEGGDTQEYSIDLSEWQSPDMSGHVVFSNLTPNESYTVYTRYAATDDSPASAPTPIGTVVTKNMARNLTYDITNYSGLYDGEPHAAYVSNAGAAEIRYSKELHGTYTGAIPHFTEPGRYTVYYYLSLENYYPAYGTLSVIIKDYDVVNTTNEATNFGSAKLLHTSADLKQMFSYTDAEKEALSDADTPAKIQLVSTDITDQADKEVIEQFTTTLDEPEKLSDINSPVHISFKIPETLLLKDEEAAVRSYRVLHLHEDTVEEVDAEMNENRELSFYTNDFSYFAIAYTDIAYTPIDSNDGEVEVDEDSLLIPDTNGFLVPDTGRAEEALASAKTCAISTIIISIFSALIAIFAYFRLKNLKTRLKNLSKQK